MKLFLDIASKYLEDKRDYYKKRAKILFGVSISMWILAVLSAYALFRSGLLRYAVYTAPAFLFTAVVTTAAAKDNFARAGVYDQIFEDLQEIRTIANETVQEMERQG